MVSLLKGKYKHQISALLAGVAQEVFSQPNSNITALLVHPKDVRLLEDDGLVTITTIGKELAAIATTTGIRVFTDDKGDYRIKVGQVQTLEAA